MDWITDFNFSLISDLFTATLFTINAAQISILKIFIALGIFVLGFFVGGFYKKQIKRMVLAKSRINFSTGTIISNLGYYTIILISFFSALNILGIDLSSFALVAGALSVGIGFGLQNIVSNFVSGIILMFERSVKVGDYIEINDTLLGHVVDIKMRATIIRTNSNINIIIPNQNFIQNNVINWTMNDNIKRFNIPFGVAYGTDPQEVIDVITEAVKQSGFKDIYTSNERSTSVIMTGMGRSSVDYELSVWIYGKETLAPRRTLSRFSILIYNALYANDIKIPFPQQDIYIRSIDKKLNLQ
ncbi:MAG: mechanosensitive ion channel [Helicobacteraceae bacterium]|nr:mechanosensitive ion channel [Helicobacteraceae bacterium]